MTSIRNEPTTAADGRLRCAGCGALFTCGLAAGESACWCAACPNVLPVPKQGSGSTCLCPTCLESAIKSDARPGPPC